LVIFAELLEQANVWGWVCVEALFADTKLTKNLAQKIVWEQFPGNLS
jgi:hypothetical protein